MGGSLSEQKCGPPVCLPGAGGDVGSFRAGEHRHARRLAQGQSVPSLSHVRVFATPRTAARQASLSITNSWSLLKFMSTESVMPSSHLILCHPLLLLPSVFPSIRVFSNESVLQIRWPQYWSFSFSISPSSEYSGTISFRMDWFDLLAVPGTLKSLLQQAQGQPQSSPGHRHSSCVVSVW